MNGEEADFEEVLRRAGEDERRLQELFARTRSEASEALELSLQDKPLIRSYQLKESGETLELRVGDVTDAQNIMRLYNDHVNVILTAHLPEGQHYFGIVSFSDSPLKPVGFYYAMSYSEGEGKVGEAQFLFVSPELRGKHMGSILTADSALHMIDEDVDHLRYRVADKKIGKLLQNLGFRPEGKTDEGYDDYRIDLSDRDLVRDIFKSYLNRFVVNSNQQEP